MLVLKWLKINCLMLYSQKNKCLVLSKYPHSDPLSGTYSVKFQTKTHTRFQTWPLKVELGSR